MEVNIKTRINSRMFRDENKKKGRNKNTKLDKLKTFVLLF